MAAIHIVFGETAGLVLKAALTQYAQYHWQEDEGTLSYVLNAGVLSCQDRFAIGPVFEMDIPSGFFSRLDWIGQYLEAAVGPEGDLDEVDDELESISDFYKRLAWIEPERPVVLWYGSNIIEQFGVRAIAGLLPEHKLYGVDLCSVKSLVSADEDACCLGDFTVEQLRVAVQYIEPVSQEMQATWFDQWQKIVSDEGQLRRWDGSTIQTVPEAYYDEVLLAISQEEAIPAARLLGEALLRTPHGIDIAYLSHRLKSLLDRELLNIEEGLVICQS